MLKSVRDSDNISDLSRFDNLKFLEFGVNGTDWGGVADLLRSLTARLAELAISVQYEQKLLDSDMMVKEDGEVKAMKTNGLEVLEPVLLGGGVVDRRDPLLVPRIIRH